jgi:hypothetical protein
MRDVVLSILVFGNLPIALACSCIGPRPACSEYFKAPLIFYGHVVAKSYIPGPPTTPAELSSGRFEIRFSVTESFRGDAGAEVIVATSEQGGMCGIDFAEGANYVVYAIENPQWHVWATGTCMRTHRVADPVRDEDLQWFHSLLNAPGTGTIYGKVRDFQGRNPDSTGRVGVLPGTQITVSGSDSRTAAASGAGEFRLEGLAPGSYTVAAIPPEGYAAIKPVNVSIEPKGCAEIVFETRVDGHIRGHLYFNDGRPAAGIIMIAHNVGVRFGEGIYSTTSDDGGFDFGPLTPGTYSFGVNTESLSAKGYSQKAVFPESIHLGPSETTADLQFVLPPDRPEPSIPIQMIVLDRQGRPLVNATVFADDATWPDFHTGNHRTDSTGKVTILLRKGSYYDIWAVANLPGSQQCAEPVGVPAGRVGGLIPLKISHDIGNCGQFKKPHASQ